VSGAVIYALFKQILNDFNNLQPTLKFSIENKKHKILNFLDLTRHRKKKHLQYSIHRKPTYTDIIIPNSSCHPYEHKMAGINYLINRMHTYPMNVEARDIEKNTIKYILHNNEYNTDIIQKKLKQKPTYRQTKPKNKMGHFYIQWKRN
jgi:hypothetical protein